MLLHIVEYYPVYCNKKHWLGRPDSGLFLNYTMYYDGCPPISEYCKISLTSLVFSVQYGISDPENCCI